MVATLHIALSILFLDRDKLEQNRIESVKTPIINLLFIQPSMLLFTGSEFKRFSRIIHDHASSGPSVSIKTWMLYTFSKISSTIHILYLQALSFRFTEWAESCQWKKQPMTDQPINWWNSCPWLLAIRLTIFYGSFKG